MMETVQPFVDTAISKTDNVPVDYPYDDFKGPYTAAWRVGLKGLATYRPRQVLGNVLSFEPVDAAPIMVDDDRLFERFDRRSHGDL